MTFIVVSHDVYRLADMCARGVWLEAGRVVEVGPSREVVQRYLASLTG